MKRPPSRRTALAAALAPLLTVMAVAPPAIARTASGTPGAEVIRGTDDDVLRGLGGNDQLLGLGDDDRLFGGPGADVLRGGDDDDRLYGGAGADTLIGGDVDDVLVGGAGKDVISARDGERDVVRCGSGRDRAVVDQRDRLTGCGVVQRRTVGDDDGGDDD